ncbi:cyclin-dependent kinase 11B isoform X4 [Schistocerca americana]|uniref:cyclin-dependent kinase 11B isoform X4 n=1 Tax=Schistocerca americana TaxID=7009 RepID=UPI001F5030ED|nr:cyclin-dependent kinase 11B isoform X4 [Schistocerca americana]XP_047111028.1 cyclin-dependent kinase 11B isoform X4 [Schistocerca piceifrons]XP_049956594.1 cyclin-dependent kinase 11B isoform X5 [Schistocerca serialis cubense]
MSDNALDMESEDQIEDGELLRSPLKQSPIQLSKEMDDTVFTMSEEEADDTADSLDIKPPQAAILHHHHHKSSSRSGGSTKRDKHSESGRRDHVHPNKSDASSRRKTHHRSREHRERREERIREKHHHRERREQMPTSRGESKRSSDGRGGGSSSSSKQQQQERGDRMLEDLRERLLDKRRAQESSDRRIKMDQRSRRSQQQQQDMMMQQHQQQMQQQPPPPPVRHETAREKAERLEKELRKERLLEADVLGKDELMVVTLSDDSDGSQEERMETNSGANVSAGEGDIVVEEVSSGGEEASSDVEEEEDDDDEEEDSETSSGSDDDGAAAADTDDSRGHHTENEEYEGSPGSVKRERDSPERESPPAAAVGVNEKKPTKTDENGIPFISDSPKAENALKEELPPYLPAIQGCRNVEEFQCLNRIEEGTYGVVYRARDKRTSEVVALKRLKMEKEKEGFPITSLREINTLLKAQHPNIVTVREIVVGSNMDKIFIVMDYVEHDLKSLMETMKQKKQVFIPGEVKCLMQQLLRAVAHLHDNWILHRDLKTSNLLLSHKGILKVGDFGLAREYGSPLKPYTPVVVTLWYRAPELLLCTKEYSTPVDMWSVGCIFGEFLSMEALFPGKTEVDQLNRIFKDLGTPNEKIWPGYSKLPAVQKMTFAEYPVNQLRNRFGAMITDVGMDLMNRFLTYDPAQRITAEAALNHDYFKEAPLPIDPAMFPTWPAKSELGHRKAAAASPKPPPGGHEYKQLGDDEEVPAGGFHMGVVEKGRVAVGAGFSLKF